MTLQERVLEVIGDKALTPKALYADITQPAGAIDFAVRRLVKDGRVVLTDGRYQKPSSAPPPPSPKLRGRPSHVRAAPGGDLTHREEHIAELAARGATAAELAEALKISSKTVAGHLTNIFVKLGIRSKTQLAYRLLVRRAGDMTPTKRAELIEAQRRKAEELRAACYRVSEVQQEMQEIEELVRMSTTGEGGG